MNISEQLHALPEFSGVSTEDLKALAHAIMVNEYPDAHEFIEEGKKGGALYFLLKGNIQVVRKPHGDYRKEYVERLKPGAMFGLISLIDHGKRAASCVADGPVRVGVLNQGAFDLLCNASTRLAQHFQFMIARQLARDLRIYNQALCQLVSDEDESTFYGTLRAASFEYRGIERRQQERRRQNDRRKKNYYWSESSVV